MDKGAHFYRSDLQVHTPRDLGWSGPPAVTEAERNAYAVSLVKACREKGLQAIAITDHHDLAFVDYVRKAAADERDADGKQLPKEQRLVVFPGMELTLNVPCQALLIFDADLPADLFPLVLNALAITSSPTADAKTAATKRLDKIITLEELRDELDKHEYLRNRYAILPNLSEGGDSLLRKGNGPKYASMPCVGGYVDGSFDKLGVGNKNIIAGKAAEYGNRRVAVFQTSDNRNSKHKELGTHASWIKWAVPTAEALRQACLAQESRVTHVQPELPAISITRLSVSNSLFLGPINLELNGQYNALIGGRGTGKSTLLEYLRWGLCDEPVGNPDDEDIPNYELRRANLIAQTLAPVNATVEVGFLVNDIEHLVRRYAATDKVMLKVGDGEFEERTEAEIRRLLPVQAFSQKQLSNVSIRVDELTRFIEAPILVELGDIARKFERNEGETRQIHATVLRGRHLKKQLAKDELQLGSLLEQAEAARGALTGLSKEDQALLEAKEGYDEAQEAMDSLRADVERVSELVPRNCSCFT